MPLTIFWLILLPGLVFYILKRKRTGLVFGFFSIIWLAMISLPFLPSAIVRSFENRFSPLLEKSQVQTKDTVYILVLGAGYDVNKELPPNDQLSLKALGRLSEGIRLNRLLHPSRLIFIGSVRGKNVSEAELLMQTAISFGMERKKISLLGKPKNTRMESLEYTSSFGTDKTLVLVTDAIHMPRAMFLFRLAGQSPIAAPTNHLVKSGWNNAIREWGPSSTNIAMMESAMHEIGGLVYARLFYAKR